MNWILAEVKLVSDTPVRLTMSDVYAAAAAEKITVPSFRRRWPARRRHPLHLAREPGRAGAVLKAAVRGSPAPL